MPNIPDRHDKDDSKEIRLFGEKSIREEAYRQKIIGLEKEIMKLASVLKGQKRSAETSAVTKDESIEAGRLPEYSEGLFYEAATSLDEKVKKYHHMLEAKARHISDRLTLQAQNLIGHENIHEHVITTKKVLIILSLFTVIAMAMAGFSIFGFFKLSDTVYQSRLATPALYERPEYIKNLLQESGFYNNQYTIVSLNYHNQMYKGIVELHFKPHSKWTLKMAAADVIENFKRISANKSIELNFVYEGNTYAKVNFSHILDETHFEFFKE